MSPFNWVVSVITSTWSWLQTYNFRGVPLSTYFIGLFILTILIDRIFG